ncbi:MAG: ligase-associated DNA damage response exonuclease [Chloroflexi bacterium OHK40]
MDLIQLSERGLYCPAGDFYIDPWAPVERAVITHAHSDHARPGSQAYLTTSDGERVLRTRLGQGAPIRALPYGTTIRIGDVEISLHPAGHILGSAQVRVAHRGEVWCVSGDYKTDVDPTCAPFEPVRCHTFVSEATFALPIYRWQPQAEVFAAINAWWRANQAAGRASLLLGYALGKAQRLLAGLDASIGPILCHGAVERLNADYRAGGVALPPTRHSSAVERGFDWSKALIIAPPSAHGTPWTRRFGELSASLASGWMRIRGARRRRAVDRGFVLSDHADWPGLLAAIAATGAERVWATHGYSAVLARWLQEQGLEAIAVPTRFEGEPAAEAMAEEPPPLPETP